MIGYYIWNVLFCCVAVVPFYALLRWLYCRKKRLHFNFKYELPRFLLAAYLATIFLLTVLPDLFTVISAVRMGRPEHLANLFARRGGVNLVPFRSIALYLRGGAGTEKALVNLLGNIVMFAPLGALPPMIWQKWRKWWELLLLGLAFSGGIEVAQHFVGRNSDIDDLLLNVSGVLLGYALWLIIHSLRARKKSQT